MSNLLSIVSSSPVFADASDQMLVLSPKAAPDERAYTATKNRGEHPTNGDDFPPPARSSPEERAKLDTAYTAKIRESARIARRPQPVASGTSERPACMGFGPLDNDDCCERCEWQPVCKPPPQQDLSVERSRRRKAQRHFSTFFRAAHEAIYGTPAPNLYAVMDVATRVQVVCLRERVSPELFLLFMLIRAYEMEFQEKKFRLEFLLANWDGFADLRRVLVQKHGSFVVPTICNFFERHDLIDRIAPLLPKECGGTSENKIAVSTLDEPPEHLFDRAVAKALKGDVAAAVLYKNLRYWCDFYKSQQSAYNFHAGCYWRYDSLDALHERFPYLSRSTIDRKLKKLRRAKYIDIDNFNRMGADKTRWYHARKKDKQGNPISPDGKITFVVEEAKRLGSIVQACVLTVIRRRVKQSRAAGHDPETLLGTNDFMFLLPLTGRTIRRAIADLLKVPELGLRQTTPPPGYAEERGIKVPRDRRWQPKIYSFVIQTSEEYTAQKHDYQIETGICKSEINHGQSETSLGQNETSCWSE